MSSQDTFWFNMQLAKERKNIKKELDKLQEKYDKLVEMSKCEHDIIDVGNMFCATYKCTKCGYSVDGT